MISVLPEWISAVGTIFALLAAFYAVRMQSTELALQRGELELQRKELARTANIQRTISKTDILHGFIGYQIDILRWSLTDEDLTSNLHPVERRRRKAMAIQHFWLRLDRSEFLLGVMSEKRLRSVLSHEYFESPDAIDYWTSVRELWHEQVESDFELEFVQIVDEEWSRVQHSVARQ